MPDVTKDITDEIIKQISQFKETVETQYTGKVINLMDGVVEILGLSKVSMSELVVFPTGFFGMVLNLQEDLVKVIVLGDYLKIKVGDEVKATGKLLSIPVDKSLIGRVIDPLGNVLDGKEKVIAKKNYPLEKIAPNVTIRRPVSQPLQTGLKAIDSMIPIGRGQRELIIGDRATGKTAIVVDTIINQKDENVICIYVAIGQRASRVAQVIDSFNRYKAMDNTIIICATASDPVSLQYLAPYAGCAIGEFFMDQGKDVLVVYDDLTKHAWAYRQLSLILKRPSGREAYPGDIFYLHSRLLERACRLDDKHGGGSLTALPIIETQAGDVSAYIPTNVISITDGQIYLESDLFYAGIRPAINPGLSVSRVGGVAQIKAVKQVAGKLRLDLAQFRELAAFAQFASELDPKTRMQIERGNRTVEILKQPQYTPYPVEKQVIALFVITEGLLDDIPVDKVSLFEQEYLEYIENMHSSLMEELKKEKKLSQKMLGQLKIYSKEFKTSFVKKYLPNTNQGWDESDKKSKK